MRGRVFDPSPQQSLTTSATTPPHRTPDVPAEQISRLFVLATPIACGAWTLAHERALPRAARVLESAKPASPSSLRAPIPLRLYLPVLPESPRYHHYFSRHYSLQTTVLGLPRVPARTLLPRSGWPIST